MRREGDKVLFDSVEQQDVFERTLNARDGAMRLMESLLAAIGKVHGNSTEWWVRIRQEGGLTENETAEYDWVKREIRVKPLAGEGE